MCKESCIRAFDYIIGYPENHIYDCPETVFCAVVLTNTHNERERCDNCKKVEDFSEDDDVDCDDSNCIYADKPHRNRLLVLLEEEIDESLRRAYIATSRTVVVSVKKIARCNEKVPEKYKRKNEPHTFSFDR